MAPFLNRSRPGIRCLTPISTWIAIVAIALQALWPLLAQAKPRSVTLVPLCTVAGETHYVEVETSGGANVSHEEHCKLCPLGASVLCAYAGAFQPIDVAQSFDQEGLVESSIAILIRHSRGPPALLQVEQTFDHQERWNEKTASMRPARAAAAGRGVVRRGVLLG